ncbi:MAG: HPr(Ser) kinase/phosphatase [bacterium]|nr:HPr(Ser) kinase/phosphatase [bacterium]
MKKKGICVLDFYNGLKDQLRLSILGGKQGLENRLSVAELNRPGLAITGFFDYFAHKRIQVFGKAEMSYLRSLMREERFERLKQIFLQKVPCIIIARKLTVPQELIQLADEHKTPLLRSPYMTMKLINHGTMFLADEFAPSMIINADHIEVYGVGVLILGKSGVGKSETALGLINRGHRLISDDVVVLKLVESNFVVGEGQSITQHFMELRGIGLINVQQLFGVGSVKVRKKVELVITLEIWDPNKEYERLGIENQYYTLLGTKIPHFILPVKPGRDVVTLVEVAALNFRLKKMGINPVEELDKKLMAEMQKEAMERK